MIDERDADRIADAITALRPRWDRNRIKGVIGDPRIRLRRLPNDVAAALAWVAMDTKTNAPNRIFEAGPWWGTVEANSTPRLHRRSEPTDCHICGRPKHEPIPDDHEYVQRDSIQPASPEAIEAAKKALKESA